MECNKDEAIRAREIAEKKMQNNDFTGAKRFALKAQQLYANLDSLSMILTVCEVHCSSQNKMVGPSVNWYDVLQVEKNADEATIKKHYRKLALLLHPDKNKFPGAEAAFKLIGEANRVLSNKMTRSVFDLQVKASTQTSISAKPPFRPSGGSSSVNKQQNPEVKTPQTNSHIFRQGVEKFWTCCPSCKTSYEYFKLVLGKQLACQNCRTTFVAYETMAPVSRSTDDSRRSESISGKGNSSRTGPEAAFRGVEINRESNGHSARNSTWAPHAKAGLSGNNSKQKNNDTDGVRLGSQKKGPISGAKKPVIAKAPRNTFKKRGMPGVVESSQGSGGVGNVDVKAEVNQKNDFTKLEGNSDAKRPCLNKRNASCKGNLSNDSEFAESLKLPETVHTDKKMEEARTGKRSINDHRNASAGIMNGVDSAKHDTEACFEEKVSSKTGKFKEQSVGNLEEDEVETLEENDVNSHMAPDTSPVYYDCLEPEFSDFNKDKERSCFKVDQIWAVYDTIDAMPRFYARIRAVYASNFKLRVTWLEPDSSIWLESETSRKSIKKWIDKGLPTACGMFKYGVTEDTTDYLMFSHQMRFETGEKRCTFVVYPRPGEVWAIFRDWDIGWADDSKVHTSYKYDFVVILSHFDPKDGVEVAYLKKLRGFISLFQQTKQEGVSSFRIPPGNLLQFSHRVPHFQMSGNERDDVPFGSYELDTTSLPSVFDEFNDFAENKIQKEKKDTAGASHGFSKKCCLDDANQGSSTLQNGKNFLKEASKVPSLNPTTVVRRSPRASLSKKTDNHSVT